MNYLEELESNGDWDTLARAQEGSAPGSFRRNSRLAYSGHPACYASPCGRFEARADGLGSWGLYEGIGGRKQVAFAFSLRELKAEYTKRFSPAAR